MSPTKESLKKTKTAAKKTKSKAPQDKKTEQLKKKLKKADEEVKALKDQLLRTAAELDNYKKRTEREISRIIQNAGEKLIIELLPILDDFDRSLKAPQDSEAYVFYNGLEMIHKKLNSTLEAQGLATIDSVGKPFDVQKHDALLQMESKDHKADIVIEEHEKGYMLNDKILRHAKVVVSK